MVVETSPHIHDLLRSHINAHPLLLRVPAQVVRAADVPEDRVRAGQAHLRVFCALQPGNFSSKVVQALDRKLITFFSM